MRHDAKPEPDTNIALPDGRSLSYLLAGADGGPVVTVLDGPCSRGLGRALAATARELGIRLVIPDRPGSQGSTPKPGRTVADWPADHLTLMDALGIERFGIVTQSGGTPYGIAVAGVAPERVSAHSLLGAIAPLAEKDQWRAAGKDLKMAAFMSRRAPFLLRAGFRRQYKKLPDSAMGLFKGPDAEVVQIPWVNELFVPTTAELFAEPKRVHRGDPDPLQTVGYHARRGPRLPRDWRVRPDAPAITRPPCRRTARRRPARDCRPRRRADRPARDLRGSAAIRNTQRSLKHPLFANQTCCVVGSPGSVADRLRCALA